MKRTSAQWRCMKQCGACCRLAPEERPEALQALNPSQRELYLDMVAADGWCKHFDSGGRRCRIYDQRPDFCRVSELGTMFDVGPGQIDAFAICCCRQQIRSVFGGRSPELRKFERMLRCPAPING
ncbi:MAG: YkgJ family cysteine cluster protein [Prochlorococcus sp.]|nr:YkgJ family cysteine cluster protein [Prochlorococcaceae cyanobacterium Fu_MAG_50]